ncbi:MAG: hypothetical protein Kow0090_13760 [Myxococcota bacterium]
MNTESNIDIQTLALVFAKSLFIGARLNPISMQSLGLAASIQPALKKLVPDAQKRCDILYEHLDNFNCHPYFSTALAGVICNWEQRKLAGEMGSERIKRLKKGFASSLAAIGDMFFWGALKPFSVLIAVAFLFSPYPHIAPIALLLVYNIPHLYLRIRAFSEGAREDERLLKFISRFKLPAMSIHLKRVSLFILGFILGLSIARPMESLYAPDFFLVLAALLAVIPVFIRRGGNSQAIPLFLLLCLVLALFYERF